MATKKFDSLFKNIEADKQLFNNKKYVKLLMEILFGLMLSIFNKLYDCGLV